MKKLITLLLLCALVAIGSAATVSVGNIAGLNPGGTSTTAVYIDSLPAGLSGYNITFAVGDSGVADIYSITVPVWASVSSVGSTPASSVVVQVADLGGAISSGATSVKLCDITVRGVAVGNTNLTATVNQMDDDSGNAVSPSANNGLIAVGSLYSTYAGIHIQNSTNLAGNRMTLNGYVDDAGTDPSAWFVVGSSPDKYAWSTSTITVSAVGNFSIDVAGAPLVAGETFYIRAACANGYSESYSVTLPAATAIPTTTYSVYFESFAASNMSFWDGTEAWAAPFVDLFGGGETGLAILVGLCFGGYFVLLFIRQEDVALPTIMGLIFGGMIVTGSYFGPIPPEFARVGYALLIVAFIGIGYSIFRSD